MINVNLIDGGGSFGGNATGPIAGLCTYTLSSIVMELAVRAGMDPRFVNTSQLAQIQCRGFTVINQYPCTGALLSLSNIFMFDPSSYDGKVNFILRGADAVDMITPDQFVIAQQDQGVDDPFQNQSERADSVQIPALLNLNYFDVAGGLATSLQSSQRIGDPRAVGSQDLQTPVILTADEAARVVKIQHQVMVEDSKAQLNFSVTDAFLNLVVADNVFVPWAGKTYRCRITQVDMNDGQQAFQLLQDRQSAYSSKVQGIPAYVPSAPPSTVRGPTTVVPLDIHIISDSDDSLGCYLAVGATVDTWQGALIEVSLDGGASYFTSFDNFTPTVMGTLDTELGDHPAPYPDQHNSCQLTLLNPSDELESASQQQMQNGVNLAVIGNELVQFGNASETSTPGTWQLDYWFRGRKSTEVVAHAPGERFVLLQRAYIMNVPMQLSYLGRTLTVRATSYNGTDADITTTTFVYTGQSQVERPVGYLAARRDGTNGVLSWQGVGKIGAGASVAMGLYFTGYRITLTDGTTTQVFTTSDQGYTADLTAYVGPVTATVQALNSMTGAGPGVQVVF
jgi:hypothetical protein